MFIRRSSFCASPTALRVPWTFAQLDLDISDLQLDSASLRYLVDGVYAAKIDQSIRDLHMTPVEFDEAARLSKLTRDPRWNEVGDENDLFE